jgi:hypothetical protein
VKVCELEDRALDEPMKRMADALPPSRRAHTVERPGKRGRAVPAPTAVAR